MANPLNSLFQPQQQMANPNIASFRRMAQMLQNAQNPNAALSQLAAKNPQVQQIMSMCAGKNPRDVFMQACEDRGIDPAQIMQELGLS